MPATPQDQVYHISQDWRFEECVWCTLPICDRYIMLLLTSGRPIIENPKIPSKSTCSVLIYILGVSQIIDLDLTSVWGMCACVWYSVHIVFPLNIINMQKWRKLTKMNGRLVIFTSNFCRLSRAMMWNIFGTY